MAAVLDGDLYDVLNLVEHLVSGEFTPGSKLDSFGYDYNIHPGDVGEAVSRLGKKVGLDLAGWTRDDITWEGDWE